MQTISAPGMLRTPDGLARTTGVVYLVLAILGMFGPAVVQNLVVPGDAATTAANILDSRWLFASSLLTWIVMIVIDITVAITLYLILEPAARALSLVAAALRVVYAAILSVVVLDLYDAFLVLTSAERAAGLDTLRQQTAALSSLGHFNAGFQFALAFFGVHLVALGVLFYRSRYVPRALGIAVVLAGAGYAAHSLAYFFLADHGGAATAVLLAPALVGELGLTGWLLVKGVRVPQRKRRPSSAQTVPAGSRIAPATGEAR